MSFRQKSKQKNSTKGRLFDANPRLRIGDFQRLAGAPFLGGGRALSEPSLPTAGATMEPPRFAHATRQRVHLFRTRWLLPPAAHFRASEASFGPRREKAPPPADPSRATRVRRS